MQHSLPQTQNSSSSSARKSAEFDRLINVEEDVDLQVLQKLSCKKKEKKKSVDGWLEKRINNNQ